MNANALNAHTSGNQERKNRNNALCVNHTSGEKRRKEMIKDEYKRRIT